MSCESPHTFEKTSFENRLWWDMVKEYGIDMCLILGSLVSRLVPLLLGTNVRFQLRFQDGGFGRL